MEWPFVISLPHSSGRIPEALRPSYALSDEEIRDSIDLGTREIFGCLPVMELLSASWSRLVVDLNRGPQDRGPKGIIAEVDYDGRLVYQPGCVPDDRERESRIRQYYMPYHKRLEAALDRPVAAMLFGCHSLTGVGPPEAPDPGVRRKDIVLGNNGNLQGTAHTSSDDTTCPAETLLQVKEAFERQGFSVSINDPYVGGYIVTHYGRKYARKGFAAIQIEINQALYTEKKRLVREQVEQIRDRIHGTFEAIVHSL